ncbi:MAG: AAA family ATPase [Nanobdellota archaeon]
MKIAITGVAGTGKTTLGKLIEKHTSLKYIPDINDVTLTEMGYQSGSELFEKRGEEGMIDWHMRTIRDKIKSDIEKENYVVDKTVFDFGARWFARFYKSSEKENHELILNCMEKGKNLYDRIIFLPLDLNRDVEDNNMRTTDPYQRKKFDFILRGLYSHYKQAFEEYNFHFSDPPEKVIKELGLFNLWKG